MSETNGSSEQIEEAEIEQLPPIPEERPGSKKWLVIVGAVLLLALLIAGIILLLRSDPGTTSQIRDVFIILMALEAFVIGVALVILIIQIAILTNILQNEVKPILNSTQETVNTLKGTAKFLSNNVSEPVIRMNEYLAGIKKLLELLKLIK